MVRRSPRSYSILQSTICRDHRLVGYFKKNRGHQRNHRPRKPIITGNPRYPEEMARPNRLRSNLGGCVNSEPFQEHLVLCLFEDNGGHQRYQRPRKPLTPGIQENRSGQSGCSNGVNCGNSEIIGFRAFSRKTEATSEISGPENP